MKRKSFAGSPTAPNLNLKQLRRAGSAYGYSVQPAGNIASLTGAMDLPIGSIGPNDAPQN